MANKNITRNSIPEYVLRTCKTLRQAGGRAWLVGGCVRDMALALEPVDWDIEVYGLGLEELMARLRKLGYCEQVGKQFGVTKLWIGKQEVDVALPRTEKKAGLGHRGFDVTFDPYIAPETASLRRDFTINAMMYEPLDDVFLDCHGGLKDLNKKVLRHVSEAFVEDPLRPLRAMQFASRFQLVLSRSTKGLCRRMLPEAQSLPGSRVWSEWLKWSLSSSPSSGLDVLRDTDWLSLYPELVELVDCRQEQRWHPEGDVWRHVCLVVDQAARLAVERGLSEKERVILVFAALCHDMGKPAVTSMDEQGRVSSAGHEAAGAVRAEIFLKRVAAPASITGPVLILVREHGVHFHEDLSGKNVAWLAKRLAPLSIQLWEVLTEADASGCTPLPASRPAMAWLKKAEEMGVDASPLPPIVTGGLLLKWGLTQSRQLGEVLKLAYGAQLNGEFHDEASAYRWFERYSVARDGK